MDISNEKTAAAGVEGSKQEPCAPPPVGDNEPTCAICLNSYSIEDAAFIKGCEHGYCACCILTWAVHKEDPWCPQCKLPFSYLFCNRQLDGTLSEYAAEESVALLKRARWFLDHLESQGHEACIVAAAAYEPYEDEYDSDPDEVEDYYFSSAAGAARIVIGNRRSGPNGYMRAGRMYARPARQQQPVPSPSSGSKGTPGRPSPVAAAAAAAAAAVWAPAAAAGKGAASSPAAAAPAAAGGRSPAAAKQAQAAAATPGRRARRKAQRAAADVQDA